MADGGYSPEKDYLGEIEKILTDRLGDRAARVSQSDLDRLATWPEGLVDQYLLYSAYYRGDQKVELTDRLKQYLERNGKFDYCENYCEIVVETQVERMKIVGVTTSEDPEEDDAPSPDPMNPPKPGEGTPEGVQKPPSFPRGATVSPTNAKRKPKPEPESLGSWLWEKVWDGSQGDQTQIEVHRESAKKGDSYLVVDYDVEKRKPVLIRNSPDTCRVIYRNGQKALAVKKWESNDKSPVNPAGTRVVRMNLYYPDKVEKWFKLVKSTGGQEAKDAGGWVEWLDDGDKVWPTPWVGPDDEPLGIPVFHFANNPDDDFLGRSELRSVIPQQDRLNKELVDLSAVLDAQGYPQRWATGTKAEGLKSNPGEVWSTEAPDANFGQFDAADPAGLLKSIESTIVRLADRSRTPRYMLQLSGGTPSGEAMKVAQDGLRAKIEDREVFAGNQWAEVFRMAALVAHVYGETKDAPPCDFEHCKTASINVKWKDIVTRNEKEHLESLVIMQTLGIPEEELWSRIDGIDVGEMLEKKRMKDAEAAAQMMTMFDRGGDANPAIDGQGKPPVAPGFPPKPGVPVAPFGGR